MEIFGVGPFELLLVVIIAFVVLGPERIPSVMRQLGRAVRQLREMTQQMTKDYGSDLREITDEVSALQNELRSVQRDLGAMARDMINQAAVAKPATTATPPVDAPPGESPAAPPETSPIDSGDSPSI